MAAVAMIAALTTAVATGAIQPADGGAAPDAPEEEAAVPAPPAPPPAPRASRGPGPAGSLLIVEESHAVPLVHLEVAARSGSAGDPRGNEGLINLAAELARRGAAGKTREQLDQALDALGARLDVVVDPDSVRLVGEVLSRNLDAYLGLLADVVLRPDFTAAEFARTRREILAQLDEVRNDDRALCARFFERRLYGDHPYGRAPDGTEKSLARLTRAQAESRYRAAFAGKNLIFGAAGDVTPDELRSKVTRAFAGLRPGTATPPLTLRQPLLPEGWRIQLVDKPDRQQTQIMLGHGTVPASHPDFLPLTVAFAAFGGRGMRATLMDEVRTQRGLAYGAYMGLVARRGPSAARAWVYTATLRTVTTLKLVLRLYRRMMKDGIPADRIRFFQSFLAGAWAAEMDAPERRLGARVSAEIDGLPADHVDTYADRIKAVTPEQVAAAIKAHVRADNVAITLVASAPKLTKLLVRAGIDPDAIDTVRYDSY
jgi:zinc protease